MTPVMGDVRDLSQFADRQFDLCFSNSLIEHLGSFSEQQQCAAEIRRVAKGYFVQTPYRYFPLEPHFQVPFWVQLPLRLRVAMHRRFDLGWMQKQPDPQMALAEVEQMQLLTVREMRQLFPDGDVKKEKVGGFVKSLIAVKPIPRG